MENPPPNATDGAKPERARGDGAQVAKNALAGWGATIAKSALQVVVVPILLRELGKEAYGITGVVMSIVGVTALADFGLRKGLTRNLAEHVATGNTEAYNRVASSAMALYLGFGAVLASAVWLGAPFLSRAFHVSPALEGDAVFLIRSFGCGGIVVSFIVQVFLGTMSSHERFDLVNYSNTGLGIASSAAMIAVVLCTDTGIRGWAVVNLVTRIAYFFAVMRMAYHVSPELRVRPSLVDRHSLLPVITIGGWLFLAQMENVLMQNSDAFILTTLIAPTAVAVYRPALGLAAVARPFVNILSTQLNPRATAYHVTNQGDRLRELLVRGTKYTLLMGVASSTVLFVFAEPIVRIWIGKHLGADTATTAHLLMLWAVIDLFVYAGGTQWSVLVATTKLRFPVLMYLPLALLNVAANALMVKYGPWGVTGILVPTLVIEVGTRAVITHYAAQVAGLDTWKYVREAHVPGVLVFGVVTAAAFALKAVVPIRNLPVLLAVAAAVAVVWMAAVWVIALDGRDRARFLELGRRGASRFKRRT